MQITYYVLRKDTPEDWKCQPYHWLPKELEIHEIVVGAFSLAIGSLISSAMACWIMNGGWTKLYFDHTEHGYLWLLIQTPLVFIWQVIFELILTFLCLANSFKNQKDQRCMYSYDG